MTAFLIVLHVLVCVFLILFVLLQPGARGGVGAAFGGAGGQTVFGGRGANTFLAKLTAAAAVIFMVTSISLSYFVSHTSSVMKAKATPTAPESAPGAPSAPNAATGDVPPVSAAPAPVGSAPPPPAAGEAPVETKTAPPAPPPAP